MRKNPRSIYQRANVNLYQKIERATQGLKIASKSLDIEPRLRDKPRCDDEN